MSKEKVSNLGGVSFGIMEGEWDAGREAGCLSARKKVLGMDSGNSGGKAKERVKTP